MTYYVKKAIPIKATQWNKNGDHPEDGTDTYIDVYGNKNLREGKVVRRYRRPDVDADRLCEHCHQRMTHHGWIDTLEGGHIVCPGDYIITGVQGEHYPCKKEIFHKTYNKLETGSIIECDHCEGKGTTSGTEPCADCGGTGEKLWSSA